MRKNYAKRFLAATLAMMMCCTVACGKQKTGKEDDQAGESNANKTQLLIGTVDAGVDGSWLDGAIERFEKKFADVSFEEGKKGVEVEWTSSTSFRGHDLESTLSTQEADVWFTEGVDYVAHTVKGNFADITDIVTEKLTDYGEDKSILNKLDDSNKAFLNTGTESDPKYYAIPYYDGFVGFTYDKDLFKSKNLYFKSSGSEAGDGADDLGFVTSASDKKSTGPDGKYGTYDDGLAATYAQFLRLFEEMKKQDIIPICYSGVAQDYAVYLMTAFWANAEGPEGMELNREFNGTANNLVQLDANGKIQRNADGSLKLESVKIDSSNGYELHRQASKLYTLELFGKILTDKTNLADSNMLHTVAQTAFLKGTIDKFQTYGLHLDGAWWEEEARDTSATLGEVYGEDYSRENRNLGWMPLPVATAEQIGQQPVLVDNLTSYAFIRGTTDVMECAKAFLQFTSTDAELSAFTAHMGMTRGLKYKLTKEYEDKTTSYGKSMIDLKNAAYVVRNAAASSVYKKNVNHFGALSWPWTSNVNNTNVSNPWVEWLVRGKALTADTYFEGLHKRHKTSWAGLVK